MAQVSRLVWAEGPKDRVCVGQTERRDFFSDCQFFSTTTFSRTGQFGRAKKQRHLLKSAIEQGAMASSRIFIKGLPPTIAEEDFKKHFSRYDITDAKLISHRRIGYVGYKTPEDAAKAVKYYNRSFIRMSKIGVEIARPVGSCVLSLVLINMR